MITKEMQMINQETDEKKEMFLIMLKQKNE